MGSFSASGVLQVLWPCSQLLIPLCSLQPPSTQERLVPISALSQVRQKLGPRAASPSKKSFTSQTHSAHGELCCDGNKLCWLPSAAGGAVVPPRAARPSSWFSAAQVCRFLTSSPVSRERNQPLRQLPENPECLTCVLLSLSLPRERACRVGFSPHCELWGKGLGSRVGTDSRDEPAFLTCSHEAVLALSSPGGCGFRTGFWSSHEGSWTSLRRYLVSVVEQSLGLPVPRPCDCRMLSLLTSRNLFMSLANLIFLKS